MLRLTLCPQQVYLKMSLNQLESKLEQIVSALEELYIKLDPQLGYVDEKNAYFADFPYTKKKKANSKKEEGEKGTVNVNPLFGSEALNHIRESIRTVRYRDNQDSRISIKFPGCVGVKEEVLNLVSRVNGLKNEFYEIWIGLSDDDKKSFRKHKITSRVHIQQTYREIPVFTSTPARLSFSWSAEYNEELLSKDAAITFLMKKKMTYAEAQHILSGVTNNEILRIKVPMPAQPRIKIYDDNGHPHPDRATLPVFYSEDKIAAPEIRPLGDFSPAPGQRDNSTRSSSKYYRIARHGDISIYRMKAEYLNAGEIQFSKVNLYHKIENGTFSIRLELPDNGSIGINDDGGEGLFLLLASGSYPQQLGEIPPIKHADTMWKIFPSSATKTHLTLTNDGTTHHLVIDRSDFHNVYMNLLRHKLGIISE
jgi:hypothetical protein